MKYINEHKLDAAKRLSDKIEKATRFNLYSQDLDSENYQVMNYGIGGTISGHVDSAGTQTIGRCWGQVIKHGKHMNKGAWVRFQLPSNLLLFEPAIIQLFDVCALRKGRKTLQSNLSYCAWGQPKTH